MWKHGRGCNSNLREPVFSKLWFLVPLVYVAQFSCDKEWICNGYILENDYGGDPRLQCYKAYWLKYEKWCWSRISESSKVRRKETEIPAEETRSHEGRLDDSVMDLSHSEITEERQRDFVLTRTIRAL